MDIITTSPQGTVDISRQQLAQHVSSAWSAALPWVEPPAGWLDAAVTALTTTAAVGDEDTGEPDRIDADDLNMWQEAAEQLRQLRAETRHHIRAAATRRAQLARLQTRVRERAIDQLHESPDLEDSLRDALADWGLPPINSDDEDSET